MGGACRGYRTGVFDGNVGIGTTGPNKPLDVALSGGIRISQTGNAVSSNELFFQDNGQIRSADNNHRIIFDRANNILELREYGDLIFSPGATDGTRTQTITFKSGGNVGIGTASPSQKLDVAGYVKGQSGLCINNDCRTAWPGGSSVLATFNGGRSNLLDNETQTNVSGSLTAPASGMLTLDYDILMESNYCGIIVKTYVDAVKVKEENVQGCYGAISDATYDGSHGCMGRAPGQARTYKASVGAGSHSFYITVWTGPSNDNCNSRGVQISPAYFQWQP